MRGVAWKWLGPRQLGAKFKARKRTGLLGGAEILKPGTGGAGGGFRGAALAEAFAAAPLPAWTRGH